MDDSSCSLLEGVIRKLGLLVRVSDWILKVGRIIVDLVGDEELKFVYVVEVI